MPLFNPNGVTVAFAQINNNGASVAASSTLQLYLSETFTDSVTGVFNVPPIVWGSSTSAFSVSSTGLLTSNSATATGTISASFLGVTSSITVYGRNFNTPLITQDANMWEHVFIDGAAAFTSTLNNVWTQNGTVNKTAGTVNAPGFMENFQSANYYSTASFAAGPWLRITGAFMAVIIAQFPGALGSGSIMDPFTNWNAGTQGWTTQFNNLNTTPGWQWIPVGGSTPSGSNGIPASGSNCVLFFGVDNAGVRYAGINNALTGTQPSGTLTPASTTPIRIGNRETGANAGNWNGRIYEMYVTSTPFSSASIAAIYQGIKNNWPTSGLP